MRSTCDRSPPCSRWGLPSRGTAWADEAKGWEAGFKPAIEEAVVRGVLGPGILKCFFPIFCLFLVLGSELRAYTLSHSISPFL
jgi:hypothetical protein